MLRRLYTSKAYYKVKIKRNKIWTIIKNNYKSLLHCFINTSIYRTSYNTVSETIKWFWCLINWLLKYLWPPLKRCFICLYHCICERRRYSQILSKWVYGDPIVTKKQYNWKNLDKTMKENKMKTRLTNHILLVDHYTVCLINKLSRKLIFQPTMRRLSV